MAKERTLKNYYVFLGLAEQHKYTIQAYDDKDVRRVVREKWPGSFDGRWFKQHVDGGYARGSQRFIVKAVGEIFGTNILFIPENYVPKRIPPSAYEHVLHKELRQKTTRLTKTKENPFGRPGVDYSAEYKWTYEPLYKKLKQ